MKLATQRHHKANDVELLYWLSHGMTVKETAQKVHRPKRSLDQSIGRLKRNNKAKSITHLVALAIRHYVIA